MKIVVLDRMSVGEDVSVDAFFQYGQAEFFNNTPDELVAERVREADIIVSNKSPMNESTLKEADKVRLICQFATGYDNVDVEYCKKRGIRVVNVQDYSTASVAQHTIGMALSLLENLSYYDAYVKNGSYSSQKRFSHFGHPFYELDGKTWGIVGMGNIGRKVAGTAQALGCHVVYYSTSGKEREEDYNRVSFEELLAKSHILSLHCPLSDLSRDFIEKEALSKMKSTAILINVARGGVVNNRDLYEALETGQIQAAGLDVVEKEPLTQDNPLSRIKDSSRLIITPHLAWASVEARTRCVEGVYENIRVFLNGEERNIVNPK